MNKENQFWEYNFKDNVLVLKRDYKQIVFFGDLFPRIYGQEIRDDLIAETILLFRKRVKENELLELIDILSEHRIAVLSRIIY